MKTKKQVIDFIKGELEQGNSIISASLGNGGSGLEVSMLDITEDLKNMDFDGIAKPCEEASDLKDLGFIAADSEVYQFSDEKGLKIQVIVC